MRIFLTEITEYLAGPRIAAASWDEALVKLEIMIVLGEVDENTKLTGELVEEVKG